MLYDSPDEEPFGFVDPGTVIRGCHLIPDFNLGRTHELMPTSLFWDAEGNWKKFCVAQYADPISFLIFPMTSLHSSFSDCDLMMWFTGLGVGHLKHKSRAVHSLTVEDEPNWLELCPATTAETGQADLKPDDESDSDDMAEEDLWCRSLSHHYLVTVAKLGWQLVLGVKPLFRCVSGTAPEGNIPLDAPKYIYLCWFGWPVATKE